MNEVDLKRFERIYSGRNLKAHIPTRNISRLISAVRLLRDALMNCGIVCIQNPPGVRKVVDEAFKQLEDM